MTKSFTQKKLEEFDREFPKPSGICQTCELAGTFCRECKRTFLSESIEQALDEGKEIFMKSNELARKQAREEEREKYIDALIWCSGSEDFQLEGKARKGWEKICQPLLNNQDK